MTMCTTVAIAITATTAQSIELTMLSRKPPLTISPSVISSVANTTAIGTITQRILRKQSTMVNDNNTVEAMPSRSPSSSK